MGMIWYVFRNDIKPPLLFMLVVSCACVYAGSFTDSRDGEHYTTVKIGRSEWMVENLRYNVRGSRCINDIQELCGLGRYYNFDMAKQACPNGWHIPSKKEWNDIFDKTDKDFNSWTNGRRSDSFLKSMVPRRQKAFAVRFEAAQGIFINPPHSFLKDAYYFNVRCMED